MSRPTAPGRDEVRLRARAIAGRLSVLADLWIAGAPPTSEQLRVLAGEIAQLHRAVVPGPGGAPIALAGPTS